MLVSEIYSNFNEDADWIRDRVKDNINSLPQRLKQVGARLTTERLFISDSVRLSSLDTEIGRPVPYTVFWFAKAFGFHNRKKIKSFALAMVYSSLVTTLRDDAIDLKVSRKDRASFLKLADFFQQEYLGIFKDSFEADSVFWRFLALAMNEQLKYESWDRTFTLEACRRPFSAQYLEDASRYFSAVVIPSLAALAVESNAEGRMGEIARFLRHFSMGWRVYDDLKDWRIDLEVEDMNHSCFLLYAKQSLGKRRKLVEGDIMNLFLSEDFVREVYAPILHYFGKAREDILPFKSSYLTKFMDEQLSFQTRTRNALLERRSDFIGRLEEILERGSRS